MGGTFQRARGRWGGSGVNEGGVDAASRWRRYMMGGQGQGQRQGQGGQAGYKAAGGGGCM